MGASAKKKREKKQDFQKPKLKVGKARPKNTNATDTSFAARSIVLKQQSIHHPDERDASSQFKRNLSLLSGSESQRKDALSALITALAQSTTAGSPTPQPLSVILTKVQPLLFDASPAVRLGLLRLLRALPFADSDVREPTEFLLWTRAGLTNLSADVRTTSLAALEWLLDVRGAAVLGVAPGGWVKTLRTFQGLLGWMDGRETGTGAGEGLGKSESDWKVTREGKWTPAPRGTSNGKLEDGKLLVRQLTVLAKLLTVGLKSDDSARKRKEAVSVAAKNFPLWMGEAYALPTKSRAYGYVNLFGAPRDVESEVYDDPEERAEIFVNLGMNVAFDIGVREAKRTGGEVGRAAAMVDKALKLVREVG